MKTIIIDTAKNHIRVEEVEDTLHAWYEKLYCDIIDITARKVGGKYFNFIVDDIGLFKNNYPSAISPEKEVMLVGTTAITGDTDAKGDLTSLSDEDVKLILENVAVMLAEENGVYTARPYVVCEY